MTADEHARAAIHPLRRIRRPAAGQMPNAPVKERIRDGSSINAIEIFFADSVISRMKIFANLRRALDRHVMRKPDRQRGRYLFSRNGICPRRNFQRCGKIERMNPAVRTAAAP